MAGKHEYDIHPLATLIPELSPEDRELLLKDIRAVGLIEPITLYEGKILDGRSRYSICKAIQYPFKDTDFVPLPPGVDPVAFVFSKNIARRHLTGEQKRETVQTLVEKFPHLSSRSIAKMAHVSHPFVEKVRGEATGNDFQLKPGEEDDQEKARESVGYLFPKRLGADGKSRRKSQRKKGTVSGKTLKKQIDDFIEEWPDFNENQKTTFVKAYRDELRELLEWVEAQPEEAAEDAAELADA